MIPFRVWAPRMQKLRSPLLTTQDYQRFPLSLRRSEYVLCVCVCVWVSPADRNSASQFLTSWFIQLHYPQPSLDIKWRVSLTVNQTFTLDLTDFVSLWYDLGGWLGCKISRTLTDSSWSRCQLSHAPEDIGPTVVSVVTILPSGSQRLAHTLEADDQTLICAVRVNRLCGGERSKFSVTFDSRLVYTAGCKLYCTSPVKFLAFIKSCSPTSVCVCVCVWVFTPRVRFFFFFFLNCVVPLGFLSREIRVAFSGES